MPFPNDCAITFCGNENVSNRFPYSSLTYTMCPTDWQVMLFGAAIVFKFGFVENYLCFWKNKPSAEVPVFRSSHPMKDCFSLSATCFLSSTDGFEIPMD